MRVPRRLRLALMLSGAVLVSLLPTMRSSAASAGDIAQLSGTKACQSLTGSSGECKVGRGLDGAIRSVVSPDGLNVYVASIEGDAIDVFDRHISPGTGYGKLTQKEGKKGCISEDGTAGACKDGNALDGVMNVAVSPDGKSVYASSYYSGAVLVFDRDTSAGPKHGKLKQKSGTEGCFSRDGTGGMCQVAPSLVNASNVIVTRDGSSVYVTSSDDPAITIFDRTTTGPAKGQIDQKSGTAGCITDDGSAGSCATGGALLNRLAFLASSPDGKSVYVPAASADAVLVYDRDTSGTATNGTLTPKSGTDACVSDDGSGGSCADVVALDSPNAVAVSPDGESVYVSTFQSKGVAIFDRDTSGTATNGRLTQKTGTAGCSTLTGTGALCQTSKGTDGARGVAVSADGFSVYVTAYTSGAIANFDRDPSGGATHGALTQKSGTDACVSETGSSGDCVEGAGLAGASGVTLSGRGTSVYVSSVAGDAVAVFSRFAGLVPCATAQASLIGTTGDDTLIGTAGEDIITALGGGDTVEAGDGNDVLCGGDGTDTLKGGAGDDFLDGGNEADVCKGGDGGDFATNCETEQSIP